MEGATKAEEIWKPWAEAKALQPKSPSSDGESSLGLTNDRHGPVENAVWWIHQFYIVVDSVSMKTRKHRPCNTPRSSINPKRPMIDQPRVFLQAQHTHTPETPLPQYESLDFSFPTRTTTTRTPFVT